MINGNHPATRKSSLAGLAVLGLCATGHAFAELLPDDEAFRVSARLTSPDTLTATWDIADDYYMYRDKMTFELIGAGLVSGAAVLPPGEPKQDPFFGEVDIFTGRVSATLPVSVGEAGEFRLVMGGQGCNEPVGVCYPPMQQTIRFQRIDPDTGLPPATRAEPLALANTRSASINAVSGALNTPSLRDTLAAGFEQREFLDVDQAFGLNLAGVSGNTLDAVFEIADGYYLYRDSIEFTGRPRKPVSAVDLPPGRTRVDEYFGETQVFEESFSAPVTLGAAAQTLDDLTLTATYQGCAVDGICYAPVTRSFSLAGLFTPGASTDMVFEVQVMGSRETTRNAIAGRGGGGTWSGGPAGRSFIGLLLGAAAAGILLTFTPCVLPMVPILGSVIAGQGASLTRARGGILSASYVAGAMLTYAVMGALAGATGDQLQAYFQNAWAIGILSALFMFMALSMFGLYEIQAPAFLQSRIHSATGRLRGSVPLVFLLGLFSALVIGACVSPVLISFLGVAMTTGDPGLGAALMAAMALGMGVPLIILGFGAGHLVPRAGPWMEKTRKLFGVLLTGVAIYLLGALPQVPVLLLWGALFITLYFFLGQDDGLGDTWKRLEKAAGVLLLVWGIVLIVGGLMGQRDILRPLPGDLAGRLAGGGAPSGPVHEFQAAASLPALDRLLQQARADGKPVMVDYYADWCVDCIRMLKTTFSDPAVVALLDEEFVSIQIDVTDPTDEQGRLLKQRFGVFGPPATLFIDRGGNLLDEHNFYGYMDPERFLQRISEVRAIGE